MGDDEYWGAGGPGGGLYRVKGDLAAAWAEVGVWNGSMAEVDSFLTGRMGSGGESSN